MNTIAGIVTYNPEMTRLKENITAIINQVDVVLIVDNGSVNIIDIQNMLTEFKSCVLLALNQNFGIAYALNQIIDYSSEHNYDWCLTLDQDSVCMEGLIDSYLKYINLNEVGMLTCKLIDRNSGINLNDLVINQCDSYNEVKYCITSGSFMNVAVTKKIGGFDNKLFIDKVDFDISLNMTCHGYKIIQVDYNGILHEMGHAREFKTIFGNKKIVYNHNPMRRYYMMRNAVYCCRKYKKYIAFRFLYSDICSVLKVFIHENKKFKKLLASVRGFFVGLFMRVNKQWKSC